MNWSQLFKPSLPKLKLTTIVAAVIASIALPFGGIFWYVGLALLAASLCTRFALTIIAKSNAADLETVAHKVKTTKKQHVSDKSQEIFISEQAKIKVIGLGGSGCSAITRMVSKQIPGVEFIAMNTDARALSTTKVPIRVQIGEKLTKGLGVGGDHNLGQRAAKESSDKIKQVVSGVEIVFIVAGMGGGTGTGAAPVVAEISKQTGALTIAVVTKPFTFEGVHRTEVAEDGIVQLLGKSDTLVIIPNDKLLDLFDQKTCVDNAFELVDDLLKECIWAVAETITGPGLITLSIADVKALLENSGPAWMSIGTGEGKNRAVDAAKAAINSPLMDVSIDNSKSVLLHISGGANLTLYEVNEAADVLKQVINPEANIIFGVAQNPDLANKLKITLIATNFASKLGLADIKREEEYTQLLRGLKTDEFSLEAFLRRCRAQNN